MKRFTSILFTTICICCAMIFTACGNQQLDMSRYFSQEVSASVNGVSGSDKLTLETITANEPYQTKKYNQFSLIADNSWFYGMYVKTISFYIYSSVTREVEFNIVLTGMDHGTETLSSATKDFRDSQHACFLKEYKAVKITIDVNDTVYLNSSNSKLTIGVSDPYTEFNSGDFTYCIYGLSITGSH